MSAALVALPVRPPFQLWLASLGQAPHDEDIATLSDAERARAARFRFERDQRRYLAAHVALRRVLARYVDMPPHALAYAEGPFGKPRLADHLPRCAFNMSHSDDVAVIALAPEGEIGVDVEVLHAMPDAEALAGRNFTATEQQELAAAGTARRDLAFLRGWTRKEACLKAIGSGLSITPETFEAGLAPVERDVTIPTPSSPARVRVWTEPVDADLVCALAQLVGPLPASLAATS